MAWSQVPSFFQLALFLFLISVIFDPCKACSSGSITSTENKYPDFQELLQDYQVTQVGGDFWNSSTPAFPKLVQLSRDLTRQALSIPKNDATTSLDNLCQSFVKVDVKMVFLIFTWNFLCSAQTLFRSNHPVQWISEIICPFNLHYSYNLKVYKTCSLSISFTLSFSF